MSLEYVIDGYNVIHHPLFGKVDRVEQNPRRGLLELMRSARLIGSQRNKAVVVFDGYPGAAQISEEAPGIRTVFSRQISADARIKEIVEHSPDPRNTVVVSDDKEIRFFIKAAGCKPLSVEDFLRPLNVRLSLQAGKKAGDAQEPALTYTQKHKINQELKKLWLK